MLIRIQLSDSAVLGGSIISYRVLNKERRVVEAGLYEGFHILELDIPEESDVMMNPGPLCIKTITSI